MGKGVTRISSRMLVDEIKQIDNDVHEAEEAPQIKMTLGSRLSPMPWPSSRPCADGRGVAAESRFLDWSTR